MELVAVRGNDERLGHGGGLYIRGRDLQLGDEYPSVHASLRTTATIHTTPTQEITLINITTTIPVKMNAFRGMSILPPPHNWTPY